MSFRDTASYFTFNAAVHVDLPGFNTGGHALGDILLSIENVTSSILNDGLKGNGQHSVLNGLAGNDTLEGGGGDDIIIRATATTTLRVVQVTTR